MSNIIDITKIPKITSEGNVGIGIAAPIAALDIIGDINFTGLILQNEVPIQTGEGYGSWTSNESSRDINYIYGNVGIGVDVPSTTFDVNGDIYCYGSMTTSNINIVGDLVSLETNTSNTEQFVIENDGTGPALKVTQTGSNSIAEFYDDNNQIALIIADGGNIGIGTDYTSDTLRVNGDIYAACNIYTSNLRLFASDNLGYNKLMINPATYTAVNSNISHICYCDGIYKAEPLFTDVWVNGNKLGYSNAANKDYDVYTSHDYSTFTSIFTITLEQTPLADSTININVWPQFIESGNVLTYHSPDVTTGYVKDTGTGNNDSYFVNTGNVGIGTDNPGYKLHIDTSNSGIPAIFIHNSANDIAIPVGEYLSIGHYETHNYTQRLRMKDNGFLGINVSPSTHLHVFGNSIIPAILLEGGDRKISWPATETLQVGHWDGTTFTRSFRLNGDGDALFDNDITTGVIAFNEARCDDGSETDPSFTFDSDQDTGMYYDAGDLVFTTGGTKRLHISDGGNFVISNGGNLYFYETGGTGEYWRLSLDIVTGGANFDFAYNANDGTGTNSKGYLEYGTDVNDIDFTGQHRTFIKDIPYSEASNLIGLIVSANNNKYFKISNNIATGSNAININEAIPMVSLCKIQNDKSCFGVISGSEDPETRKYNVGCFVSVIDKEVGDTRVHINSLGEGAIWVSDINGNLESGDYITTSSIPGYGMKQNDGILHNYTVAKITMNCDFVQSYVNKEQIVKDGNGENILDENGEIQWEDSTELIPKYIMRFITADGNIITEDEYNTNITNNIPAYKAVFAGCTYHCG